MAYTITSQCISCKLCLSVCPTGAVKIVDDHYLIDSELCTNCVGSIHTVPQCKAVCPTANGCVKQPSDYWESWFSKYNSVLAKLTNKQDYWECWYNTYSQKFSEQLKKQQVVV
ncbi:4Fe-4S binding protein [Anabaena sphaerica FACHB-251]|uniref:4Fe-4S binding protein n=1 Tax=Anabaena sphaerica FACHB-251 TaxID=2692883 RepID=A0A927A1H4_9NOST|nr:4Fe-4S binding protein [Anabaena sphaerica]MBD2294306.1 4Fe-4S binding protein [Anabaena sphaerica FACHB-251]